MSHPVDVHPEDLFDREQDGTLTSDQRRRLDSHTARCAACALVRSAVHDFAIERSPRLGDEALIARLTDEALGKASTVFPTPSPELRNTYIGAHPRRRRSWAVGAIVLFAATGATASFWSVRNAIVQHLMPSSPGVVVAPAEPSEPKATGALRAKVAFVTPPTVQPAEAPAESATAPAVPAAPIESTPVVRPQLAAPSRSKMAAPINEAPPAAPAADELFAAANEARRRGDSFQSMQLYWQLQRNYPGTREETTSRVLLGRLVLDRGGDPSEALTLFTRYLDASPSGTLAEEARLGKAVALTRLGSTKEERHAWQQLLAFHPTSIHAERARKRLEELR